MLAQYVGYNNSLLSLHLSRKQINSGEGIFLAKMLRTNKTLRKLELEGNNLGPECAYAFGRALRVNTTLKYLDLESNNLTNDGTESGGITDLFTFLPENKTLLSLNLANNGLDESCGEQFNQYLDQNSTLIDFDYALNSFNLDDSRSIQDKLMGNKRKFDEERLREWRERKMMLHQDEKLRALYLADHSTKEQARMEEEAREIREAELNEKWKKFMLETEIEKQQVIK